MRFLLFQRDARGVGSYLGGGSISDGGGMLTGMAKLMKQELASDAEEEGLVPALSGRFTSMRKVPSLSDLSDPESSLGEFFFSIRFSLRARNRLIKIVRSIVVSSVNSINVNVPLGFRSMRTSLFLKPKFLQLVRVFYNTFLCKACSNICIEACISLLLTRAKVS